MALPRQITLPVVGMDHPNKSGPPRRWALKMLRPGDPVELRAEPNNPKDPQAIAVYGPSGVQVGYLPAERVAFIHLQWRHGEIAAVFQAHIGNGGLLRLAFDGESPSLPIPAPPPQPAQDWWPDEEWPDD